MRKLLAISIFCFVAFTIKAQSYGNEWINFSQQYFKFPIAKEGIYRIDSPKTDILSFQNKKFRAPPKINFGAVTSIDEDGISFPVC